MKAKKPVRNLIKRHTGNPPGRPILTSDEQVKVVVWIAQFKTPTEVVNLIKEKFKKTIRIQSVYEVYFKGDKWQDLITQERERYLSEVSKVPIANKRVRLERLEKIYEEAMAWSVKTINQWGVVEEQQLGAAIQALDKARVEIEGDKALFEKQDHYHLFDSFKDKTDEELQKELDDLADQILEVRKGFGSNEKC